MLLNSSLCIETNQYQNRWNWYLANIVTRKIMILPSNSKHSSFTSDHGYAQFSTTQLFSLTWTPHGNTESLLDSMVSTETLINKHLLNYDHLANSNTGSTTFNYSNNLPSKVSAIWTTLSELCQFNFNSSAYFFLSTYMYVSVCVCTWCKFEYVLVNEDPTAMFLTGAVSMRVCADPSPHGPHVCGPNVSACIDPSPHALHERGPVCTLTIASCSSWARSIVPDPSPHVTHGVRSTVSSV